MSTDNPLALLQFHFFDHPDWQRAKAYLQRRDCLSRHRNRSASTDSKSVGRSVPSNDGALGPESVTLPAFGMLILRRFAAMPNLMI